MSSLVALAAVLLLLCDAAVQSPFVDGLQSPASGGPSKKATGRSSSSPSSAWKSSPASLSIQDSQRVHEILRKRRTRRGRPDLQADYDDDDEGNQQLSNPLPSAGRAERQAKTGRPTMAAPKNRPPSSLRSQAASKPPNGIDLPFGVTLVALQAFHEEHSHLVMSRRYLVPATDAYPKEFHGLDLAGTVYNMRWWQKHVRQRPDRVIELRRLGFVWERLQPEWNLILEALIVYRALHGHVRVPASFEVPCDDEQWPRACWGIALGAAVCKIRIRGDHLRGGNAWSRRNQLDAVGFVWDTGELKFSKFCAALHLYGLNERRRLPSKQQSPSSALSYSSSTLKIPSEYVVPRSSRWPNEFWGYPLGDRCAQVRQKQVYVKGHPDRLKTLADLGFFVDGGGNDKLRWLEVVHAAAVYSQMNRNSLDVPTGFLVPAPPRKISDSDIAESDAGGGSGLRVVGSDEAWPWPEYLWGFPLGQRLRDIRVKGYYLRGKTAEARRRQLDALGFDWEPRRGRPRKQGP